MSIYQLRLEDQERSTPLVGSLSALPWAWGGPRTSRGLAPHVSPRLLTNLKRRQIYRSPRRSSLSRLMITECFFSPLGELDHYVTWDDLIGFSLAPTPLG